MLLFHLNSLRTSVVCRCLRPRVLCLLLMLSSRSEAPACGCVTLPGHCSPESFQGFSCVMPLCLLASLHLVKLAVH